MQSSLFTLAFAAALIAGLACKLWLATRQMRHVAAHRGAVPAVFRQTIDLPAHQKAADYTLAKGRLGLWTTAFSTAVLLGWTLLGGLTALDGVLRDALWPRWGNIGYQLALLAAVGLIGGLLELPWSLISTFRIEQRFGFNRMGWRLWLADACKGYALALLVGGPLAALALWIMAAAGGAWWLWMWAAWMSFNLLVLVLYPLWIAPLFNTFTPLQDDALKARVDRLMQRCGFAASGFFVMDGSRRSAHGNAYFTGFGAAKRVVFFDTLLHRLDPAEVEAVLAHELGHYKHRHIVKRVVSMAALSLAALFVLGWLSGKIWFYTGLGVLPSAVAPNDALALLLFSMVVPTFSYVLSPCFAALSRRQEFEADAYACAHADAGKLQSALLKLHEDNAATLTPDPLYARFYYSHPPAAMRLGALSKWAAPAADPSAALA